VNLELIIVAARLLLVELAEILYDLMRASSFRVNFPDLFPGLSIEGGLDVLVL